MSHPSKDLLTSDHLLELAAEFRAMAMAAPTVPVIDALNALADRYTILADCKAPFDPSSVAISVPP